jgi:nucleoside-diphosphate-sugar epimerase
VDNAADAHVAALDRLSPESPIAGRVYFISQGEPVELWPFINRILELAGLPPVSRRVPFGVAYRVGWLLESWYRWLGLRGEPPMTRFLAAQLAHSHWFDISAARRDLDYTPRIGTDEGLRRLAEWLRNGFHQTSVTG